MSCVILQVGQCGNQIGECFWNRVDELNEPGYVFKQYDGYYRSVAVDTEPKVLKGFCNTRRTGGITFRNENVIMDRSGRGNNWAFGYYGRKNESEEKNIFGRTMRAMRKEIERCDSYCGTLLIHSLSGGTGSGVGSRLLELLRDEYPLNYIVSCAVAPFSTGESPLQNYNSLLSLSALSRLSDGIIMFSNDDVLWRLKKRSRSQAVDEPPVVSLSDINQHIAACLCGLIAPVDSLTPKAGVSIGMEPWEMLQSLCPMPSHKFLHVNSVSRKNVLWENMTSSLVRSLNRRNHTDGSTFSSLANLVVARGDQEQQFPAVMNRIENQLKSAYQTVKWNPFPVDFWVSSKETGQPTAKSLTVGSNYSNIIPQLEAMLQSSRTKLEARAYLHWYEKYGCTREDFLEAFDNIQTVVDAYKDATCENQ